MTVNSQQNKISYVGNGVATEFAIPFSYLDKSHLTVWQMLNGVQSERTDWTAADGTLIFKTAPENNAQIVIMRQVPLTQETDYRENEILSAETLERCFDKLTMQVQQLEEKSGRAVTVDVFDDTNAASLIPSIRKAVSDCTAAAVSARANADTASEKAVQAQTSAINAASAETHTAAMLSTKASVGLDNLTAAGKEKIIYCLVPDYSTGISVSLTGISEFTAPYDCFVVYNSALQNGAVERLTVNGNEVFVQCVASGVCYKNTTFYLSKDDVLGGLNANDINRYSNLTYFKLKGSV